MEIPDIQSIRHTASQLQQLDQQAVAEIASSCPNLAAPSFRRLGTTDLESMFRIVDRIYVAGHLTTLLRSCSGDLKFRLAGRMTHTAGSTTALRPGKRGSRPQHFTIAIAPQLVHENFVLVPSAAVCGLPCADMRAALLRIMQHEMIHLAEFLIRGRSSCAADPFKKLVHNLFGHTESRHRLLTPWERARLTHGVVPGDTVTFEFEGQTLAGRVNRISRRATVLVPAANGTRYSDGHCYRRFYVPLDLLRKTG